MFSLFEKKQTYKEYSKGGEVVAVASCFSIIRFIHSTASLRPVPVAGVQLRVPEHTRNRIIVGGNLLKKKKE